jgi:LysR family transcriptional regulator, flagellar master operon regulator
MDIAAARTFVEIVNSGSFVHAATNLNLTQTAVSARIRVLEDQLGQQVFNRTKVGVTLTPAGEQFMPFAVGFVQMWERARSAVSLGAGRSSTVSIGAELCVARPLVANWLRWMRKAHPELALAAHINKQDSLVESVRAGTLDLAVLYGSPRHPNLVAELLVEEKLVLCETTDRRRANPLEDYVAIEWSREFTDGFHAAFPDLPKPAVTLTYGPVALDYLLSVGGSAYLRTMVARPLIGSGQVRRVPDTPEFSYSIYAVYSTTVEESVIHLARQGLQASMAGPDDREQPSHAFNQKNCLNLTIL